MGAIVIKTYGDESLAREMAGAVVAKDVAERDKKIKRLQAELGIAHGVVSKEYLKKIKRLRKKYKVRKRGVLYHKAWGLIGLICCLIYERSAIQWDFSRFVISTSSGTK